jgi:NADH-quinone oxidoreductase subunit N
MNSKVAMSALGESLLLTSPVLVLFGVALAIMLIEAISRPKTKTLFWGLGIGALLVSLGLTLWLDMGQTAARGAFSGMLRIDHYGAFFSVCSLLAGVLSLMISNDYLERIGVRVGEYYALVLFGVMGMILMAFSADLMMVFVSLEVMSIAMYILCALKRADPRSVESGFKYFILGAFSSGVMLYGIAFLYGAVGSTSLAAFGSWFSGPHTAGQTGLIAIGGAMLLVGFGFKVASVPFHMWAPDVYQGAPVSVTALMASGVKAASFAAFGRVVLGAMGNDASSWAGALWWMSALTMVVGNLGALVQTDLKRILAYSSIAHAGYLMMALSSVGAGGVNNPALGSLLFYMLAYTFMNAGAFAVLSMLTRDGRDNTELESLSGLGRSNPWLAAGLTVCLLSLAGVPPTMGFVGKFYLFTAALAAGQTSLAIIGALAAAAGVYYYLRPLLYMYMREGHPSLHVDRWASVALAVCTVLTIGLGMMPGSVLEWAKVSVETITR